MGEKLVFKGGTCLHHCYLEQQRFSEDLDFSAGQQSISFEEVRDILTSVDYLTIKKQFLSKATIKIERLLYTGPLGYPNSIKLDIDVLQNVILPVQEMSYRTVWGIEFPVKVMDIREIFAEKIRAMSDRARYRDFFDVYLIFKNYKFDLQEIIGYIRKKEKRTPISKAKILKNWDITRTKKELEEKVIFYSQPIEDALIEKLIQNLPFDEIY
ncbi:MAG: nucleotidyl transferase AbiEii/AbiGii toxin family protein [Anaerolineaceae bacterium]|nr:nucleotidyl transferase AbiEii/AbiGii toxin family protein [Anaerolineaceae bacterium]